MFTDRCEYMSIALTKIIVIRNGKMLKYGLSVIRGVEK